MQLELIHQAIISLWQPDMLQIGGVLMEPIFPSHLSQYKTEATIQIILSQVKSVQRHHSTHEDSGNMCGAIKNIVLYLILFYRIL